MLNLTLLLGASWTEHVDLDVYFWLRALAGVFIFLVFVLLLDWFLKRSPRSADPPKPKRQHKRNRRTPFVTAAIISASSLRATAEVKAPPDSAPAITVGAAVETYFSWNFNRPDNDVTAFRGFDTRHNSFALSNAVLDSRWTAGAVTGRLALQTGDTPDIYYGSEATSDVRHILEATVAWKAPVGKGLTFDGGIFLSPIGPESILVKDDWTWSRSTLFYALPFYHAGFRATYPVADKWNVTAAVYNGWNDVTDTNGKKSISVQALYTKPDKMVASFLYFGGVERPRDSAEGQLWRHLFDGHITLTVNPRLWLQVHGDTGFEDTRFGRASWRSGALVARIKATPWLFVAGRADVMDETTSSSSAGSAAPLFFPAGRVHSFTGTLDAHPADRLAVRLEWRHDAASAPIYFKRAATPPSARSQSTLTLGLTAWF